MPLDAWQVGPWNRWAYVHVDEVVPTAAVARGGGPAAPLPAADAGLEDLAADLLESGWVDGLAVLHRGTLLLERYGGEADPASLHLSQSVGKSVLGLLVGALAGQGRLDPDAPVTAFVPEVRGSGYDGARVSHLLDMTAAVDFTEDYAVDFWRYDVACAWCPPREGAPERSVLEFLPGIRPAGGCSAIRIRRGVCAACRKIAAARLLITATGYRSPQTIITACQTGAACAVPMTPTTPAPPL